LPAESTEDARLRHMDVAIDKTRHNEAARKMCGLDPRIGSSESIVRAKSLDQPVFYYQQAVGIESCCFLFVSNVFPRIID
jgi:hypothetical protein